MNNIQKEYFMNYLRAIRIAKPDLFPLNADEIDNIEQKAATIPAELTDTELFLLSVSEFEGLLYRVYESEDPDNGDDQFYNDFLS